MRRGFRNSRNENSIGAFATTSSETSSTGSSWSAVQQLSEEDKMAVIRGNARSSDIFCGLEETAVDSDEDDLSSVNTEVNKPSSFNEFCIFITLTPLRIVCSTQLFHMFLEISYNCVIEKI